MAKRDTQLLAWALDRAIEIGKIGGVMAPPADYMADAVAIVDWMAAEAAKAEAVMAAVEGADTVADEAGSDSEVSDE